MSERILLLGAGGMLGRCVWSALADRDATASVHTQAQAATLDPTGPIVVTDLLDEDARTGLLAPGWDVVINCAGIVRGRDVPEATVTALNAELPHQLARSDAVRRVVQVSTDCVFSGVRGGRDEDDVPDPDDLYARTKLAGELGSPHLTVRTSFIGRDPVAGRGLLEWLLAQTGTVPGYRRAMWNGVAAPTLARVLVDLAGRPSVTGVLHIGGDVIDKASLLEACAAAFGRTDLTIEPRQEPAIDRTLRLRQMHALGIEVPSLAEQLRELAS